MLNIILFGPPGAGKGTQSAFLLEKYNLTYVGSGDMLRGEIAEGSELGKAAESVIERGELVSDDIIVKMVRKKIMSKPNAKGFLFDGFPRTVAQAEALDVLLEQMKTGISLMFSLNVPEEVLVKRLANRGKMSGRPDDNPDVIRLRLKEYRDKTCPVADYYKKINLFKLIDGVGAIDDVKHRLEEAICALSDDKK